MYSPFDSHNKFVMFNPKFKLPTYLNSRVNLDNVNFGALANAKRNIIINQHNYITNGPGTKELPNKTRLISYTDSNSIKIKNVIYMIPPRLCKYIPIIRQLAEQNMTIKDIIKKIEVDFSIINPLLPNVQPSIIHPTYTYPKYDKSYKDYSNVGDFNAPFKLGKQIVSERKLTIIQSQLLFPIQNEVRYVFVSCNDNKNYTNDLDDMKSDGIASFWGTKLSVNGVIDPNLRLPVFIFPFEDATNIMYGFFITIVDFPNRLMFVPVVTFENFPIHKDYYTGMLFNIKTNLCFENFTINYNKLKCRYVNSSQLYNNS